MCMMDMRVRYLLPIAVLLFNSCVAVYGEGCIVGYENKSIKQGFNRVEINFDDVNHLFSTIDDVLRFTPADGIVGDELSFSLDGKVQTYRVDSFDGNNYVLHAKGREFPRIVTLDAFPLLPVIWVRHNNTNEVTVTKSGAIEVGIEKPEGRRKEVTVCIVDVNDSAKNIPLNLTGGHIGIRK